MSKSRSFSSFSLYASRLTARIIKTKYASFRGCRKRSPLLLYRSCGSAPGSGCLSAFRERRDFFSGYSEDTILAAVMTCNGCKDTNAKEPAEDEGILEKADRLVSEKISVIHVGVCRLNEEKKECPRITQICGLIEERGIKVIRGTHKE